MTEAGHAFVADLAATVGSFDRAFVAWRKDGVTDQTAAALDAFWRRPEVAAVRAETGAPHLEWDALVDVLLRLADGEPVADRADLTGSELTGPGPVTDRTATAAVSLYALAGWIGACGDGLVRYPPDPGWFVFPARAAEALLAADAVHGADLLTSRARDFVDEAQRDVYQPDFQARLAPLRRVAAGIARRRTEDVAELAWDLHLATPDLRAHVAALFWTIGDVPRAELTAHDPVYVPSLHVLGDLVTITMSRVEDDPLLQYLWLGMKDRPPLDLRRHHRLFAKLNARYTHTPLHQLDDMLPIPVGRAYADALVAHFGPGPSDDQLDLLGAAYLMAGELTGPGTSLAVLRLRSLVNLVLTKDEVKQREWRALAERATSILEAAVNAGTFTAFHRCLALPAFYLDDASGGQRLSVVEEHRSTGLRYWLTAAAPPARADARLAGLQQEEAGLLNQLRAARFVRLVPSLPGHYRRFTVNVRGAPYDPLDQDAAQRRLIETWDGLAELWGRMAPIDASYAHQRQNPAVTVDEFVTALTAPALGTRPVGPTPIVRRDASAFAPPDREDFPDDRAGELGAQAAELVTRYHQTHDLAALDEAIRLEVEACGLLDQGSADHLRHLDRLSTFRAGRYLHTGDAADLEDAIAGHEAAVTRSHGPDIDADLRIALRFNAGMSHHHRYDGTGDLADLRRALDHWEAAVALPDVDPLRAVAARGTYADGLRALHDRTEDPGVADRIVATQRAIVDLTDQDDRNLPGRLATLALDLLVQASNGAGSDEAIELMRRAVELARRRDPRNLVSLLNNLAAALLTRDTGSDLDEAISALDEAAANAPIGPLRARLLRGLADAVDVRHDERGDPSDARRATQLRAEAQDLDG